MKNFKFITILTFSFVLSQQIINIRNEKISLEKSDESIRSVIEQKNQHRIEKGLKPLSFDSFLMEMAQTEAERLADLQKITTLEIKTNLKFVAYIFKIEGFESEKWVGKKAFFTNLTPMKQVNVVDIHDHFVGKQIVDGSNFFSVGYGKAMSKNGDIFGLIIFLTTQNDLKENKEQIINNPIDKVSLEQSDESILAVIEQKNQQRLEKGLKPISFDGFLMETAQNEAKRLADLNKITSLKLESNLKFVAYIFKIEGLASEQWIGKKAFFTNLTPMKEVTEIDINQQFVGQQIVDGRKILSAGYGKAMSKNGDVFGLILFFTRQKDKN